MISWHRFYDPDTGRYISADPIGLAGGMNLYNYVQGNPVNLIDPKGLDAGVITIPITTTIPNLFPIFGPLIPIGIILYPSEIGAEPNVNALPQSDVKKDAKCDEDPDDLCEQLAFAEAKAGAGRVIMRNLGDEPRLIAHYGPGPWVKKQYTKYCPGGKKVTIHYFNSLSSGLNVELKKVNYGGGVHPGLPGIVE